MGIPVLPTGENQVFYYLFHFACLRDCVSTQFTLVKPYRAQGRESNVLLSHLACFRACVSALFMCCLSRVTYFTAHSRQQEHRGYIKIFLMRCIVTWGLSSAMMTTLHNQHRPSRKEINESSEVLLHVWRGKNKRRKIRRHTQSSPPVECICQCTFCLPDSLSLSQLLLLLLLLLLSLSLSLSLCL